MPEQKDDDCGYSQKLISLYEKRQLVQRSHSQIELAQILRCSKQTVLLLVEDNRRSYGVEIEEFLEGKRMYYQ